jgi:hypothetical protein
MRQLDSTDELDSQLVNQVKHEERQRNMSIRYVVDLFDSYLFLLFQVILEHFVLSKLWTIYCDSKTSSTCNFDNWRTMNFQKSILFEFLISSKISNWINVVNKSKWRPPLPHSLFQLNLCKGWGTVTAWSKSCALVTLYEFTNWYKIW